MSVVKSAVEKTSVPLAVVMSALFLGGIALFLRQDLAMDFGVYWRVAAEPLEIVYQPRKWLNFPYPPTMLLWIAPLALVPKWVGFALWSLAGAAALAAACGKHLRWKQIALVLLSPPAVYCFLNGQVSVILAALLLWACSTRNNVLCGVLFAVIFSIKPQLVLMAPIVLVASRNWQAVISGAAAFAMIVGASVLAFGVDSWLTWLGSLDHFNDILVRNGVLAVVITPAGVAELKGLPVYPIMALGAVTGAIIAYRCRDGEPLVKSAAIATGSLLAAPYAVIYDLVAVAPFIVWSIFNGRILATIAFAGGLNPLPLLVTGYELYERGKAAVGGMKPVSEL